MNDPHVVALIYSIEHRSDVDFAKAPEAIFDFSNFTARIKGDTARIELKEHFASHEVAIAMVEPFLKAWELQSDLNLRPGEIEFHYRTAEIIDRNPPPRDPNLKTISVDVSAAVEVRASCSAHVSRGAYQPPPNNLAVTSDIEDMQHRYRLFHEGRALLPDTANYCLTKLECIAGGRDAAAQTFGINKSVLGMVGNLAANKGGREGRKGHAAKEFTGQERAWLTAAIKMMIRRAAEVAFDPKAALRQITLADLPPL